MALIRINERGSASASKRALRLMVMLRFEIGLSPPLKRSKLRVEKVHSRAHLQKHVGGDGDVALRRVLRVVNDKLALGGHWNIAHQLRFSAFRVGHRAMKNRPRIQRAASVEIEDGYGHEPFPRLLRLASVALAAFNLSSSNAALSRLYCWRACSVSINLAR
jgi:hypothetical protein